MCGGRWTGLTIALAASIGVVVLCAPTALAATGFSITKPTPGQHFDLSGGQAQIPYEVAVTDTCGGGADLSVDLTEGPGNTFVDGDTFHFSDQPDKGSPSGTLTAPHAGSYKVSANYTSDCAGGNESVAIEVGP